jgi:general secretion pathway protein N
MLRRLLMALAFALVFLIGLIAMAPASLLSALLERSTQGKVLLANPEGGFWSGSGVLLLCGRQEECHTLGRHHWRWLPSGLEVQHENEAPMTLALSPLAQRATLRPLQLTLPVSALALLAPQLAPYKLQGWIHAESPEITVARDGVHGTVTLDWHEAASGFADVRPLGDYRIVLHGEGQSAAVELSTLSGPLRLQGRGRLGADGAQFSGTAQAAPDAGERLRPLLQHIGPQVSPGVHALGLMAQ